MRRRNKPVPLPTPDQVEQERERLRWHRRLRGALWETLSVLLVTAAISVLAVTLFLTVLQVSGSSMGPLLKDGDILVLAKGGEYRTGDLVGLHYEGKILLKRVIGCPGDTVSMDEDGTVYLNGAALEEPYAREKSLGECDTVFPYLVPEGAYFVLGDRRASSIDSRSSAVGAVREEKLLGRVLLRIWPLNAAGWIS